VTKPAAKPIISSLGRSETPQEGEYDRAAVIAHWDDVEPHRRDFGHVRGEWTNLGLAAGSMGVGVHRIRLAAGEVPTPQHVHPVEEEIFFVLEGSGLSKQDDQTYEIRAGDCIVHVAAREAHTLRAGEDGLVALAFGHRMRTPGAYLPNAKRYWLFPTWTEVAQEPQPYEAEPELDWPEPSPRPANIVNVDEVEADKWGNQEIGGVDRSLGASAGSVRTGLHHEVISPGQLNGPPHCHSAEEEIFVVLEGGGTLLLGDEEHPLRPGHVVARPPGTRVAHCFRADDEQLTLLTYGTREPNDITYYPRSRIFALRGVGVFGRLEPVDPEEIR
jgi:uncharacterized cupin superfamily protein